MGGASLFRIWVGPASCVSPRVAIMCRKYGLLGIGDKKDQLGDVVRVALDLDLDLSEPRNQVVVCVTEKWMSFTLYATRFCSWNLSISSNLFGSCI